MKRRWIIGSAGLLVLVTGVVLFNFLWPDRLTSEASIRRWLRAVNDRDSKIRQQAEDNLKKARDPARVCVIALQMRPTRWETLYATYAPKVVSKLPRQLAERFPPPILDYSGFRVAALAQLSQLGPKATNAVPVLINLLDDPSLRTVAARTLARVGRSAAAAVPKLAELITGYLDFFGSLSSGSMPGGPIPLGGGGTPVAIFRPITGKPFRGIDTSEATTLIMALGEIGVRDESAVQALARCLTNLNPVLQLQAAESLWTMEHDSQRLIKILSRWIPYFQDPPNWSGIPSRTAYRRQAVGLVAKIAEADRQALPILEQLVNDHDIPVRLTASRTLYKLDGQTNIYLRVRSEVLKEGNEQTRWICLAELEGFPGHRDVALPLIIGALKDASNRIRGKAAMTLGNLGAAARTAVPALTEALGDSHSNVREAAEAALKKID